MDELEERFSNLESQVVQISHNMTIFMVALENKFEPFKQFGDCNSKASSDGKFGDKEDQKKRAKKEAKEKCQVSIATLLPNLYLNGGEGGNKALPR